MIAYWLMLLAPASSIVAPNGVSKIMHRVVIFLTWAALTFLIGGRYEVGCDWATYQELYYRIGQSSFIDAIKLVDPAYGLVSWVCFRLNLGVEAVNVVCGGIFAAGLVAFCRRQPLPWLTLLVATPMLVIVVGMGFTRQAAAIGVLMFAFNAFVDRRVTHFLPLIALAACFHATAVVFAPAAFLLDLGKRSSVIAVLVSIVGMLLAVFLQTKLQHLVHLYIDNRFWEGEGTAAVYRLGLNAFAGLLVLVAQGSWRRHGEDLLLYRIFAIAAVISFPFSFIEPVASDRLGIYMLPLQAAVFGRTPLIFGWRRLGPLLVFGIIASSITLMVTWFRFATHSFCWVPYQNVWF